ncbi:sugar transporter [Gigaspora margarita]|uniref:Sugar transporter n=1 Tax=Gigaspora margarita TaxID=4874 RepID=A0A8H4AI84_GIGMA|nr:sugar transporter [Gigaspora margarita]
MGHGQVDNLLCWSTICMDCRILVSTFGYGTPYLVSLGLSPELIALVWFAGPLSGFIIQPLVGAFSDKCTSRMGRRRPFMIIGGLLVCLSMVSIAYSKEWAATLCGKKRSNSPLDDEEIKKMAIMIAVVGFYILDFSLNAVQASIRALVLDIPPVYQQEAANAWAGRMLHIGNIVGYFTGFLDLLALFPFLGSNQLQVLCIVAIIVFTLSLLYTCLNVKEQIYEPVDNDPRAIRYLPSPIQKICNVQFFSWMGWFPFLFFSSSWIASVYARTHSTDDPDYFDKSTRYGSFALLIYSWTSFVAGALIPQITPTSPSSKNPFTIYNIYIISHILFALIAWCTLFVNTVEQSIILIGSFGIPWAISMWVPFALVGEYVQQEDERQIEENTDVRPLNNNDIEQDTCMNLEHSPTSSSTTSTLENEEKFAAGMILGVHNLYIVLPQLVVSLTSSMLIKLVNDITHDENNDKFGWVFRFGGIMAIIAAILSRYLDDLHVCRR